MADLIIKDTSITVRANNLYCIGRNYAEHAKEMKNEVPTEPIVFLKPNSSIIHHGASIHLPDASKSIHHELEMVIVIGKCGKHIPRKEALNYVLGYGIGIDVTARDLQKKAKDSGKPWTVSKGYDTFAPISDFLSPESIPNPDILDLSLHINGSLRQSGNTSDMIFNTSILIHYLSTIFTLQKGDLIFTGTPEGVAEIKSGDKLHADLGKGLLTLDVTAK